jgi:hypothetical protein
LQTQKNGWSQITTEFVIPENFRDSSLTFYIFNPTKNNACLDDLEITRLKMENWTNQNLIETLATLAFWFWLKFRFWLKKN